MSGAKPAGHGIVAGGKRSYQQTNKSNEPPLKDLRRGSMSTSPTAAVRSSTFRNVSACNRCRQRKNRCDFALPACGACTKAGVKCVGFDGKREVPRSYVFYLEQRVENLEALLESHGIDLPPADDVALHGHAQRVDSTRSIEDVATTQKRTPTEDDDAKVESPDDDDMNRLVDKVGMVPTQGTSDPRYLGSASGISFARVVFAAIRSSVLGSASGASHSSKAVNCSSKASMRDSFFGLHSKTTINKAGFPDKELAMRLVDLYFNYANAQLPILHREEFLSKVEQVYNEEESMRSARDLYMLNIVFAIGAGVLLGDANPYGSLSSDLPDAASDFGSPPMSKKRKLPSQQCRPEEYHASAVVHLESFLGSNVSTDFHDGFGSGLEELQAVLLLASFALLRPIAPGLWYIVGVAVRLAIDLGLHHEEGVGIDESSTADNPPEAVGTTDTRGNFQHSSHKPDAKELGRRQWTRDLRRRLFWSTYSLDRIVSICTGRPFGISDQVITTEFCSELDDAYITPYGILPCESIRPSYKVVAHHYFRLRLLQSEILGVLLHRQARQARANGLASPNAFMVDLPSPYLHGFDSFRAWRESIDFRLLEWKDSAPQKEDSGVQFNSLFLELNYWQAIIMLYRQSFSSSATTEGVASSEHVTYSPMDIAHEEDEEDDLVYWKIAQAGQRVVKLYRQLHRLRLVNYTYLATHHLFMAGISFLFAIWHSQVVRNGLALEDIDSTVLAAGSVLEDLTEHCPPAQACREAFDRMSKAIIKLCLSTKDTQYQTRPELPSLDTHSGVPSTNSSYAMSADPSSASMAFTQRSDSWKEEEQVPRRPVPQFDMNFQNLLSGGTTTSGSMPAQAEPIGGPHPMALGNEDASAQFNPGQAPFVTPQDHNGIKTEPDELANPQLQGQSYPYPNQAPVPPNLESTAYPGLETTDSGQLDFLNSFTWENGGNWGLSGTDNLDLGIGMQLGLGEGRHDWSDGTSYDMLDGFFFGGGGAGSNNLPGS